VLTSQYPKDGKRRRKEEKRKEQKREREKSKRVKEKRSSGEATITNTKRPYIKCMTFEHCPISLLKL